MSTEIKRALRIAFVVLLLGLTARADSGEPFGLATAAAPDTSLALTWRRLLARIDAEQPVIAHCRAEPQACSSVPAAEFLAIVAAGAGYDGLARIGHINEAANLAIRAVPDGMPDPAHDQWTSPLTTLALGAGDCKQFAVLKYAALAAAGFAGDDVRIVIVERRSLQQSHAVVAVREGGRWLVLDNRSLTIVESGQLLDRYLPLYSLDRRGVRRFIGEPQVATKFGAACAS